VAEDGEAAAGGFLGGEVEGEVALMGDFDFADLGVGDGELFSAMGAAEEFDGGLVLGDGGGELEGCGGCCGEGGFEGLGAEEAGGDELGAA
jgi:hypothetical protein